VFLLACARGPRPVRPGADTCAYCLMGLATERFSAEIVERTGRIRTFDSIECLARYLAEDSTHTVRSAWVTDYESPPRLLDVRDAYFVRSDGIGSPMGLGFAALASAGARDALIERAGGTSLDWTQVRTIAGTMGEMPAGDMTGHVHGTGSAAETTGPAAPPAPARHADGSGQVADEPVLSIADAIAAASAGDTIRLGPGVYSEPEIVIEKPIVIEGSPGTVIDGSGKHGIILVRADDVTLRGLTLRNPGTSYIDDRAAIRVEGAQRCTIEDNRIVDGFFGIYLARAEGCVIRGNRLDANGVRESASGNGIHLWYSNDIRIEDNTIRGYRDGLYFEFVKRSRIARNTSEHNLRYGLHFMFSDDCTYDANRFIGNGVGVAVMYTSGVDMTNNRFAEHRGSSSYGLLLKEIRDSRITSNTFFANSAGLHVEGSDRLTVSGNEFRDNGWAIRVMANSESNRFEGNDFIGNSFDVATNSRQNYSTFRDNYWDGYSGFDLDHDGTGDSPYRPVRLFSLLATQNGPSLILMRSFFIQLLDAAEALLPSLTPATLIDERPRLAPRTRPEGGQMAAQ
jgi:nitrous oxidase accessory protein